MALRWSPGNAFDRWITALIVIALIAGAMAATLAMVGWSLVAGGITVLVAIWIELARCYTERILQPPEPVAVDGGHRLRRRTAQGLLGRQTIVDMDDRHHGCHAGLQILPEPLLEAALEPVLANLPTIPRRPHRRRPMRAAAARRDRRARRPLHPTDDRMSR